jgi:hypothetical protein
VIQQVAERLKPWYYWNMVRTIILVRCQRKGVHPRAASWFASRTVERQRERHLMRLTAATTAEGVEL